MKIVFEFTEAFIIKCYINRCESAIAGSFFSFCILVKIVKVQLLSCGVCTVKCLEINAIGNGEPLGIYWK